MSTLPIARLAKALLLAAMAFFFALVVFNNITDYDSNYQFVRHVLAMDTTFPDSHTAWRAIRSPAIHLAFYIGIILWETLSALLGWAGAIALFRARHASPAAFASAKRTGTLALTAASCSGSSPLPPSAENGSSCGNQKTGTDSKPPSACSPPKP